MREPNYWLRILSHYDLHGRDLAVEKVAKEAYGQYTASQIQTIFKKYYIPTRQFRVTSVPTKATTDDAKKKEAATAPGS